MDSTPKAFHGGAFFDAIGVDFRSLERNRDIISADVLDAWYDPSPVVVATLREHLPFLLRTSPPTHAEGLVAAIAEARQLPPESILAGGGSSSLIFSCLPPLLQGCDRVLLLDPTYGEYEHVLQSLLNIAPQRFPLDEDRNFEVDTAALKAIPPPDAVLLVNPNSPTGVHWPKAAVLEWLDTLPTSTLVWIDETYIEYAGTSESLEFEAGRRANLIIVKSMSKVYSLSGMRVAYLVAHPVTIRRILKFLPPWSVGLAAQVAAVTALRDPEYYADCYAETHAIRDEATAALRNSNITVLPSGANFYLARFPDPAGVAANLRHQQIYVREFQTGSLANRYLRIAVKDRPQTNRILAALGAAL